MILSGSVDIFYPRILAVLDGKGVFQQPRDVTLTILLPTLCPFCTSRGVCHALQNEPAQKAQVSPIAMSADRRSLIANS